MKTFRIITLLLALAATVGLSAPADELVKLSGTVVDKQGNPIADAEVGCYRFPSRMPTALPALEALQRTTTDSKGAFTFSIPRSAVTVVAKKEGVGVVWKTWESLPTGTIDPLVIVAPSTLAGIVVNEKDQPVADAEVSVSVALDQFGAEGTMTPNVVFGKAASDLFSARSSEDGHFQISGFPIGAQANLAVKKPGHALRLAKIGGNGFQLQAHAGQGDIKLVIEPAASIAGTVVFKETGAPLAHAKLELAPVENQIGFSGASYSIQSAADGTFRIPEVPAGSYRVTAVSTNEPLALWVAENVSVTVAAGETARDVKIQAGQGGVVEVTVVGKKDQKELPNVRVFASSQTFQTQGTTKSDGVTSFRLPAGQITVFAMKEGLSQSQTQTTVAEGETSKVRLELDLPSKMTGTVRDSSGSAVAGTSVAVFPNYGGGSGQDSKTDADGHYEVTWQTPSWAGAQEQRYYMVARNAARKLAAVHEIDASAPSLDLELKPAMSISGRAQDVKGNPITNATASVSLQMVNMGFPVTRQPIRADEQGRLQMEALPPGEEYTLYVFANGYGSGNQKMGAVDPKTDHYDFPAVVLKLADHKLAGRVLGTDGQPVANAQIWMRGEGQPNGNAMSDANGRFSFDAVCEGALSVSASSTAGNGSAQAIGGDTNVVIRFNANNNYVQPGSLTLTGTVFDPSGNPAPRAHVTVTPAWGMVDSATTDKNGEFSVRWQFQQGMRGAKYFAIARDTDHNLAGIEPIDEKKTHVSIRLEASFSISGTVQDANGAPISGANVNLNMMAGNMGGMVDRQPVRVGTDGTFTIPALPMGQQYHVSVSANGYGSGQKAISKIQSRTNSMELPPFKLRTADREIAGQVLDTDGKPLPGVYVNTYGNNQPNGNMQTDVTGHFKFKVCEGTITVNAYSQGAGRNNYGSVQARDGDKNVVVKMGVNQNQQRRTASARTTPLKPQPWTLSALIAWPASHKTGTIIILSLQMAALLGTGGGIFWMTRMRKP